VKKLRFRLEIISFRIFYLVVALFPDKCIRFLCKILAVIVFDFLRIRRKVTIKNLKLAFREKPYRELKKIARKTYENFAYIFIDMALLNRLNKKTILKDAIIEGKEVLEEADKRGKGAILVSGHIGNWERIGYIIPGLGYRTSFITRMQSNPYMSELQNSIRKKFGIGIIFRSMTLKKVLKELKERKFIAMLSDQDAGEKGMFLNFFGVKASTPGGAAKLALRVGAGFIFCYGVHLREGFQCKFEEIEYSEDEEPENLMQRFVKKLEEVIKKYPTQYFWMHKRWKSTINYK